MRGASHDHRLGDAGQHRDLRGDAATGIDQGLEGAPRFAAADLDGTHLGDGAVVRRAARRLEVEHTKRHLGQRRAEVVEGSLP